ncbi:MAG: LacI family transcriptional regulator [Ruminococcaceae bacterium]|nr:LacI family transcriptional regulator [Oscillospiraceae bacterium]
MQKDTFLYKKVVEYLAKLILEHYGEEAYKLPTEAKIGEEVGVSRITVRKAYALLEEQGLITRAKRGGTRIRAALSKEDILSLLRANGYVPELVPDKDKSIAVILPLIGSYHVTSILSAIIDGHTNETIIIDSSAMSLQKEQELIDKYIAMNVDGIILYPVDNEIYNPTILQLSTEKFPLILVDRLLPGLTLPYVSSNHENMVKQATNHLLEAGHRHILFFNANIKTNSSLSIRKESFINTLSGAHNCKPYFYSFEGDADPTSLSFCDKFREFLDMNPKISAIVTADYASGLHLIKMLSILGDPYAQYFDIVYLDFNPMQFETAPPHHHPTYIMQNSYQIGADAINLMQRALSGTDISNTKMIVPASIVLGNKDRQSPRITSIV